MMRKLFWCCSTAGVLVVGGLFSISYYASVHPDSMMSRCITTAAGATIAMQPIATVGTVVARATHHVMKPHEPASKTGSVEECIPADPQPAVPETVEPAEAGAINVPVQEADDQTAPIVIKEDEVMPGADEMPPPPSTSEMPEVQGHAQPDSACPLVMPYCTDDDDPKPCMPKADGDEKKQADGSDKSEEEAFQEWMKFFKGTDKDKKDAPAEELPPPTEEPQAQPTWQEDRHIHEHYPGCPHTTCPYTGRSYPSCTPATKSGKEEISEEPVRKPKKHSKKAPPSKGCKSKDDCPHTEGVDTMEYRKSDGGLNEYGHGPLW